eukprot:1157108-Pelagomonas_calceolata.AAC.12
MSGMARCHLQHARRSVGCDPAVLLKGTVADQSPQTVVCQNQKKRPAHRGSNGFLSILLILAYVPNDKGNDLQVPQSVASAGSMHAFCVLSGIICSSVGGVKGDNLRVPQSMASTGSMFAFSCALRGHRGTPRSHAHAHTRTCKITHTHTHFGNNKLELRNNLNGQARRKVIPSS